MTLVPYSETRFGQCFQFFQLTIKFIIPLIVSHIAIIVATLIEHIWWMEKKIDITDFAHLTSLCIVRTVRSVFDQRSEKS